MERENAFELVEVDTLGRGDSSRRLAGETECDADPVPLSVSGYAYWSIFSGAPDAQGDYFVSGSLSTSASVDSSIPVFWKDGGSPSHLDLGSNGVPNNYGTAYGLTVGP